MKRLKRPGYLKGTKTLRPRKSGFGFSGTAYIAPMPDAPPIEGATPPPGQMIPLNDAINKNTGHPYLQDSRCPEGEKLTKFEQMVPCQFPDDCDPGEMELEVEWECEDDPDYMEAPPPPPAAEQAATAITTAEEVEDEGEELPEQIQTSVAAPSGTSPTALPPLMPSSQPTTAEEAQEIAISKLIEEHQNKQMVERALAPVYLEPAVAIPTTSLAPTPARATKLSTESKGIGLVGWIKKILFGENALQSVAETNRAQAVESVTEEEDGEEDGLEGLSNSPSILPTLVTIAALVGIAYWWNHRPHPRRKRRK